MREKIQSILDRHNEGLPPRLQLPDSIVDNEMMYLESQGQVLEDDELEDHMKDVIDTIYMETD